MKLMSIPILRTLRGRRSSTRKVASGVTLGVLASSLVILAAQAEGTPISDVDLHDGSVWVTNTRPEYQYLGRLNPQIRQIDLGIQALAGDFDVHQDGTTVFLDIRSGGRGLRQIDVAAGTADDTILLTPTTTVAFGGDTIAMVDTDTGAAWIRTVQTIQGFVQEQSEPDLSVGRDAAVTVGVDGTAYLFDSHQQTVTPVGTDTSGLASVGSPADLPARFGASVDVTVVGDTPILFDRDSGRLLWPSADEPVQLAAEDRSAVRLQHPSSSDDGVLVATRVGLTSVSLRDGSTEVTWDGVDGPPAAPLRHRGYVHAAWADPTTESYLRLHETETPHSEKIPEVAGTANLVFRANRDAVVLNDIVTGVSWLVQEPGLPRVDNWDDVNPNKKQQQVADPEPDERAKARRTEINRPPTAKDDDLGARPGADTLLPLARNDLDPDGDILTIDEVEHVSGPAPTHLSVVGDGTQLQVRFPQSSAGKQARFRYVVTDGRENGTDDATATVSIIEPEINRPPEVIKDGQVPRPTTMTVARGQRASVHVLQDWTDPDGDAMILEDARIESGGIVTFRPDGMIEFVDDGQRAGEKKIDVVVSDGRPDGQTEGKVVVSVSGSPGVPPLLVPDRAVGIAGTDILVEPLANDFSRDGTPLTLRSVVPLGGLEITQDSTNGTFVARTSRPGTYYLDYSAYTDRGEAASFVRLDVLPATDENLPPVAMRDEAMIPLGGHALVDVLVNDHDPEGDVLAVTEVNVPLNSGVKASLINNRLIRLEAVRDIDGPVILGYAVSDGINTVQGSVTVTQAGPRDGHRPPVAQDDRVRVRAGAIASVPVLENDFHPDGDSLQLFQTDIVKPDDLPLFVSGEVLRFRAPSAPGELRVTYGVRDSRGQRDDAELIIDVIADDPDVNATPRPDPVEARVVGDRPARIDLMLQGSDPDGDAVSLKGLRTAPDVGRVTASGLDWLEYQPYSSARGGTDTFEVEVQDKYGATAIQQVRVGVVARATINQAPVALDDRLLVRPGRTIQYNVLVNDSDPDGDDLILHSELEKNEETSARVEDGFITVEVPEGEGASTTQSSVGYTISDGAGGSDSARFTIDASPDAPLYAPITRDDAAALSDVAGKSPGEAVLVDVLENDGDLDGRREDLRLVAFDTEVSSVLDDQLNIVLAAEDQVIVYEVHDIDDNISYGFAFVAGTDTVPPVLNPEPGLTPIEMEAGENIDIALADYVLVRAGREPRLTVADRVTSAPFAGGAEVDGDLALRFTAPGDHHGPAAVTFEVTDGSSLNDSTGLTALLTIPIDVLPGEDVNFAPELRDIEVQVVAGDDAEELRVDLAGSATDPNPEDVPRLEFHAQSTDKVDAGIEGSTLVLNAKQGVADGDVSDVPIAVQDPDGERAEAVARVFLVRSDRPLVSLGTIGPLEAEAGVPLSININDHATNPFQGEPLTVANAIREVGEGSASASGSTVTVTPGGSYSGPVTVSFTVLDGSGDPDREVTGRLDVTVVAAPEPPGRPNVSSLTHNSVTLNWTAAADKGAPVTDYTVTHQGGSKSCGGATTCLVDGLTPGDSYSFTVTGANRVGTSDPSPVSELVTPDRVPDPMPAPQIRQDYTNRDQQLTLEWKPPANVGSDIRSYEIMRLGSAEVRTADRAATSFHWKNLKNGDMVQFKIRAVNDITDEPRKQRFSEPSSPDKAFGAPRQIARPQAKASADDGLPGGRVEVTWQSPDANGDNIDPFQVTMYKNGAKVTTKNATGTSSDFEVENGNDYTFTVVALNRAGPSTPSEASEAVNPWDRSSPVRNLQKVDAGEGDRKGRIRFDAPADDGGRPIVGYRISSNGGPTKTVDPAGTYDVAFNANSGPYEVTVIPVTRDDQVGQVEGGSAKVSGIRPFSNPFPPTGGSATSGYRAVSFSGWKAGASNGRPVLGVQYKKGSGAWTSGTSTSWATEQGGDQRCISVRTVAEGRTSSDRLYSTTRQICGNAQPRKVTVRFEQAPYGHANCSAECWYIKFRVDGFKSGQHFTGVRPNEGDSDFDSTARSFTVGSDGRFNWTVNWWYSGYRNTYYSFTIGGVTGGARTPQ